MDCVRLADAQLIQLIREGGEPYFAALHELEQRHFRVVRSFAAAGTVRPSAADELAYQAWEAALRQQVNGSAGGSLRACALSSVLSTASVWSWSNERAVLNRELAAWFDANGPVMLGNTATAGFRRPSLVARAFACLPCPSQTLLWHQTVEHDDAGLTGRLVGAAPGDVSALTAHAQEELHSTYAELLRNGMGPECRSFQQLVLAYADARSTRVAMDLVPHLERCALCSRAVGDLGRVRHDCGPLLAEALLPWGGLEHAARGTGEGFAKEFSMPGPGMPGAERPRMPGTGETAALPSPALPGPRPAPDALVPGATAHGGPAPEGPVAEGFAPAGFAPQGFTPGGFASEGLPPASLQAGSHRARTAASGRGRHAAGAAAGSRPRGKGLRRTDLIVRGSAVAGVCAVAAAFAFAGDFDGGGEPQSQESAAPAPPPPADPSPSSKAPSPSRSKPTASASSTASKTSRPAPPKPDPTRPSPQPAPGGAVVEWLFDDVDGNGVTPDSSDNGKDGTLFGSTRPTPAKGGALVFGGEQFVAAEGPLVDTSSSFTVSARVKLDRTDVSQTVVSQDASESSGFQLQYDADESRWEMRIPERDTDDEGADADEAVSESRPRAGEWTHLTGVYDDAADQVRLYVDGRLGETAERDDEDDYGSGGNFAVGRGLLGREFFQGADGTIDDVRAYGRALSSAEARSLARKSR